MIFLSAQPDDFYFTWQLELQIYNFNALGIAPEDIHILISCHPIRGVRHFFKDLIAKCKGKASFFVYPDMRMHNFYIPSIRPYLIQQHLKAYPSLVREAIFYHDSDIIFRELPDFDGMIDNDTWYVSDTREYLDTAYIKRSWNGAELFQKMCAVVGIEPDHVVNNDENCGGAQYLLKNTGLGFWEKVEKDCESLYRLLNEHVQQRAKVAFGDNKKPDPPIEAWCADMWAVFWNALLMKKKVRISEELDFCWPRNSIEKWNAVKIFHYSGNLAEQNPAVFSKGRYVYYSPIYDREIEKIDPLISSIAIKNLIDDYKNSILNSARINLKDVSFLFWMYSDSEAQMANLSCIVEYIVKHFDTNILLVGPEVESCIVYENLMDYCRCFSIKSDNEGSGKDKLCEFLVQQSYAPILAVCDSNVIVPTSQILESVNLLRTFSNDIILPYDGRLFHVDQLFHRMFGKLLDSDLLVLNKGKFALDFEPSCEGAVFVNKNTLIAKMLNDDHCPILTTKNVVELITGEHNVGKLLKKLEGALFCLSPG